MAVIYWAVYPSAQADPSAADIKGASVSNGFHANETAPTSSGTFTSGSAITGLTASTSYKLAAVWSDGVDDSNVVVSAAFTTAAAGSSVNITVPVGSVSITGFAVTVEVSDNQAVDVPVGAVTVTGFAPTISVSDAIEIDVPAGSVAVTGFAPTVIATDNKEVTVPTGSVTFTGLAPSVNIGNPVTIEVPTGSVSVTGFAPTVDVSENVAIEVPTGSVSVTGYAPTVGFSATVEVPTGSVSIIGYAPTASASIRIVSCTLVDASGNALPGLVDLSYAWFDEPDPANLTSPVVQGVTESTDGSGVIEVPVTGTSLSPGETGLLILRSQDGVSLGAYNLAVA